MFSTMFQITCFSMWKNIVYLVYVYVCVCFFFLKLTSESPGWNWKMKLYVLLIKCTPCFSKYLQKCHPVWNLKSGKRNFPNSMFKLSKISNITQTFLKYTLTKSLFFFLEPQFSVFKHWKLLFGIAYQTSHK